MNIKEQLSFGKAHLWPHSEPAQYLQDCLLDRHLQEDPLCQEALQNQKDRLLLSPPCHPLGPAEPRTITLYILVYILTSYLTAFTAICHWCGDLSHCEEIQ